MKSDYQAVLLPKFDFIDIGGAIDPLKISFKLDDVQERSDRLTELKDKIVSIMQLDPVGETHWDRYKTDFFAAIDSLIIAERHPVH